MTLDEAVKAIEDRFVCLDGPADTFAPTGEQYLAVCSGGLKHEGGSVPALCTTPEIAIALWLREVKTLGERIAEEESVTTIASAENPLGQRQTHLRLYWRIRPELGDDLIRINPDTEFARDERVYLVYSRLLITAKPEVARFLEPAA
jgi:hypothetical protein